MSFTGGMDHRSDIPVCERELVRNLKSWVCGPMTGIVVCTIYTIIWEAVLVMCVHAMRDLQFSITLYMVDVCLETIVQ